jgi:hypothetical protein
MEIQHLVEKGTVWNCGYEFIVTNLRIVQINGKPTARFEGICTDNPVNDDIKNTGYNGGTYGGNNLAYTWEV